MFPQSTGRTPIPLDEAVEVHLTPGWSPSAFV